MTRTPGKPLGRRIGRMMAQRTRDRVSVEADIYARGKLGERFSRIQDTFAHDIIRIIQGQKGERL